MENNEYVMFTKEMKKTHTILVPNMLPNHFKIIIRLMKKYGYNMVLLENSARRVVDEGLKSVHNDTCYPALLVIGQFLDALKSGEYELDKTALLITQTGGGCRASNYIHLLRKALATDFPEVPVISLNFSNTEKSDGFKLTVGMVLGLVNCIFYGDLIMTLYNQCKPYEICDGDTDIALNECLEYMYDRIEKGGFGKRKKNYRYIIDKFNSVKRIKIRKPRVGIVGEIYVKYSPLANNNLEKFLLKEGCEPVVPGLMDFVLYCIVNYINDGKIYGFSNMRTRVCSLLYGLLRRMNKTVNEMLERNGFTPAHDFEELRKEADELIHQGVKMGEGWLITAEMGCLAKSGTENIVCTQPFGCLPNHIVAKGMSRRVKEKYPQANIVAIDYDPSATNVNQENRLKLMIANIGSTQKV
ncbi:MAG: 2-hydroxyacyl-CoA dehydratase [Clostridia bacterium]|nr:2-hydroxyacyl-CoA dehydratase [Clostridia bacterium]